MSRQKKKNRIFKNLIALLGILTGLFLLAYPGISELIKAGGRESLITSMTSDYNSSKEKQNLYEEQYTQALLYNAMLAGERSEKGQSAALYGKTGSGGMSADVRKEVLPYEQQMTADGDVMGYVEIPSIGVRMMIYPGTDENALMAGAGHIPESSLPVGGPSSHCVITAHSGMKTMRAFDDIRLLEAGDLVLLHVLGNVLAYKVTSNETVLPDDTSSLSIQKGKDLLTLVTCTPYGINSHRLLVHCERTAVPEGYMEANPADPSVRLFLYRSLGLDTRSGALLFACCLVVVLLIIGIKRRLHSRTS